MIEADDNRVCGRLPVCDWSNDVFRGIHPLVAEEYEMHGITTMDSDWWSTRTQRDFDAMYEQQGQSEELGGLLKMLCEQEAQRADEPTAEVSAAHNDVLNVVPGSGMEYAPFRAATEDDYFAEFARMRATIAELSRRPTMEQYLAVCESAARITKAFEMAMDTWHQLQAEYDALSGRVKPRKASAFPANALRHSV